MIVNVPEWQDLETISLQLYFNAWDAAVRIVEEFETAYQGVHGWEEEWTEYLAAAQTDLQAIYTLTQQSQEIGIKARIATVSPYLLLKRHETKAFAPDQYDFTDFPTIDAGELVKVHNTFCATKLSNGFADEFDKMRRARNKIAHLGIFKEELNPKELLKLLLLQYRELYPNRKWLPDRALFASKHRWAQSGFLHEWSPEAETLNELWHYQGELDETGYVTVFGHEPSEERYICPPCGNSLDRYVGGNEPYPCDVPTAYMSGKDMVHCVLCLMESATKVGACDSDDCEGTHLSSDADYKDMCLVCGVTPDHD